MRAPRKLAQFHLWHLLFTVTVVAVLIQPSRIILDWVVEKLHSSPTPVVSVPNGGTIIIGGIIIRPDGTRQLRNSDRAWRPISRSIWADHSTIAKNQIESASKANNVIITVTPRIIIQEEDDEMLGWPTDAPFANQD